MDKTQMNLSFMLITMSSVKLSNKSVSFFRILNRIIFQATMKHYKIWKFYARSQKSYLLFILEIPS